MKKDIGTLHRESLKAVIRRNKAKRDAKQHVKDLEELRLSQEKYFQLLNS